MFMWGVRKSGDTDLLKEARNGPHVNLCYFDTTFSISDLEDLDSDLN